MMEKYIKIAKQFIKEETKNKGALIKEAVFDYGEILCFHYQSKKILGTDDERYMWIGQGPIFILKKDNRIFDYGSAFSRQNALIDLITKLNQERIVRLYIQNYDFRNNYGILINKVYNKQKLISILLENKLFYTSVEIKDKKNITKYHTYSKQELNDKLKSLPSKFNYIYSYGYLHDTLVKIIKNQCCDFELYEAEKTHFSENSEKISEENMSIIW